MYFSTMISIGKVDNGFIVEACVPLKRKEGKDGYQIGPSTTEKHFIAKDAAEVGKYVQEMLPLLDADYNNEKEFGAAFDEACGADMKETD